MGSLKDELLKAKVVSKKDVKRSDHEERVKKKEVGAEELRREKETLKEEIAAEKAGKRERDRRKEEALRKEREGREKIIRLEQKIRENAIREAYVNSRRFHFVARNGGLPYLEVSEDMVRQLETGRLAIVEIPRGSFSEFFIVPGEIAGEILKTMPDWVRCFNE